MKGCYLISVMQPFSLKENVLYSYRTYFALLWKTFFAPPNDSARLTPRRFVVMIFFSLALFVVQSLHWLAFAVDEILYQNYKSIDVREPLFIVGVPRSGTTFLHRLLSQDRDRFTTFTLWELLIAPSVTERKIVFGLAALDRKVGAPLKRLLGRIERSAVAGLDNIHRISLSDPEEDYFTLVPIYACFILILPFPFPEYLRHLAFFDDDTPRAEKDRIMGFYKTCLQRHLYVHGTEKRLLSKNVSFSPMLEALTRTFPDCRFIGTVRNPRLAIPSQISSMTAGAAWFGNHIESKRFTKEMMAVQRYAYSHLMKVLPQLAADRQVMIRMEDLSGDLYSVITAMYGRFGFHMTPAYQTYLREQERRQKAYKSGHVYDPAWYNLSDREIFLRFRDVYRRFGYGGSP